MTTKARAAEADRAAVAFHLALTQLGIETVEQALALWNEMPTVPNPSITRRWLRAAVHLVTARRKRTRQLAMAYYRLNRALRTGVTVPDPTKPRAPQANLNELRRDFADLAGEVAPEGPDEVVEVQELPGLKETLDAIEAGAEREARLDLEALGPGTQNKLLEGVDDTAPAAEVDALREEAHARAGARQAATASRVAQDGARSTLWAVSESDSGCIGYVRVSRTGTPCGWCAMLISRGPVYRSERSATYKGGAAEYEDGDKYHDNCNCYAMPIFGPEQFAESDLFRLNREYQALWPQVTRGLSGKAALSAWRRFIRQEQRAQVQEARASRNVQEA